MGQQRVTFLTLGIQRTPIAHPHQILVQDPVHHVTRRVPVDANGALGIHVAHVAAPNDGRDVVGYGDVVLRQRVCQVAEDVEPRRPRVGVCLLQKQSSEATRRRQECRSFTTFNDTHAHLTHKGPIVTGNKWSSMYTRAEYLKLLDVDVEPHLLWTKELGGVARPEPVEGIVHKLHRKRLGTLELDHHGHVHLQQVEDDADVDPLVLGHGGVFHDDVAVERGARTRRPFEDAEVAHTLDKRLNERTRAR